VADHWWDIQIERLAYRLWQQRGRPIGSPEIDWFRAERLMQERDRMIDSYGDAGPQYDLETGGHLFADVRKKASPGQ
jgi:hypothetical protein